MAAGFRAAERSSEKQHVAGAAPLAFTQDFALATRVLEGDARAQKQLALRLMVRVRRAAHALMGGAPEADDAAQHALIEILRSTRGYSGDVSLESWADRLAVRSLVRFARAVRTRSPEAVAEPPASERPERHARTLEELLRELPSAPREALLLREAFGFDLIETAQLLRSSTRATREQLSRARHSLYLFRAKDADAASALPEPIARWFALRDQSDAKAKAVSGIGDPTSHELLPSEQEELRALEAQPELRRLQKELRALAQFVDGGRFGRLTQRDRKLIEGALAAARVSSLSASQAVPAEAARDAALESPGGNWVHPTSLALCVAMVVGAFVALALRKPAAAVREEMVEAAQNSERISPTVEALSSAQPVERGARLSRSGQPLSHDVSLREGDVVSAQSRPACFGLSPRADVCLAPGSRARIAQLTLSARRVELLSGRAVASVERVEPGVPFGLSVGELRIDSTNGVVGVEIDGDKVVLRVLRGSALIAAAGETHALASAQSAIYATRERALSIVPQLVEKARRDWDLLATRALAQPSEREAPASLRPDAAAAVTVSVAVVDESVPDKSAALPEASPPTAVSEVEAVSPPPVAKDADQTSEAPVPDAEALLAEGKLAAREQRFADADRIYLQLIRSQPSTRSAREALVLRGEVLSERLHLPSEALSSFDRYLASGGGMLDVRARYGRILALRQLNRAHDERVAMQQFLNRYGGTPQARVLRARYAEAR